VAEKLGRKWIGSDLGKFAIHTTRKRMIQVQRAQKEEGKDFRAFEILNLGKYERAHYIGVNMNLREEERKIQLEQKEKDFIALILRAYKAEAATNFKCFHGKKAGRVVAVGPINSPVTRLFVEEIILECREKRISLELKTPYRECALGCYKIAAKVVDIFGNDTMKIIEVGV